MAAETVFGDGRSDKTPLAVVPLGSDGEPASASNPMVVSISDGANTVSVLRTGAGEKALLVRDREQRRLLEAILLELINLNKNLAPR